MEKLKEKILLLAKETNNISYDQLCKLLIQNQVSLSKENFNIIYSFLNENGISLRNTSDNKGYALAK